MSTNIRRSGKTRLVQCAIDEAVAARGLVVQKKFEVNSTNQLYLVLSAFNDLCEQLATSYHGSAKGGTLHLWDHLVVEFGPSLHMLANILPNVIRLTPSLAAAFSLVNGTPTFALVHGTKGYVNFVSLCEIIKRFMRIISATSLPVMMVLDDLQWSDPVSRPEKEQTACFWGATEIMRWINITFCTGFIVGCPHLMFHPLQFILTVYRKRTFCH
jgi:predicted ATPase